MEENKVLILACKDSDVFNAAKEAAEKKGIEVVRLEDKVITDYLSSKQNSTTIEDLVNDPMNRAKAENFRKMLWDMLTRGTNITLDKSSETKFTEKDVVKRTTLTHKKAKQLFALLSTFGLITYTKGNYEFVINFNKTDCQKAIRDEVLNLSKNVHDGIVRYKSSIFCDGDLKEEEKNKLMDEIKDSVLKYLEL